MNEKPNYNEYSLYELRQVLKRIDSEKHPDRVKEIKEQIKQHNNSISEQELNDLELEEENEKEESKYFNIVYGFGFLVITILVHFQYIVNPFQNISNSIFGVIIGVSYIVMSVAVALIATWSIKSTSFVIVSFILIGWFVYWSAIYQSLSMAFLGPVLFIFTIGKFMACERCREFWKEKI